MSDEQFPQKEIFDHMERSLHRARERLANLNEAREPYLKTVLDSEVKARQSCYEMRHTPERITGWMRIWWEFILSHAKLQILRDRGTLSEAEFHHQAMQLIERRDAQLER